MRDRSLIVWCWLGVFCATPHPVRARPNISREPPIQLPADPPLPIPRPIPLPAAQSLPVPTAAPSVKAEPAAKPPPPPPAVPSAPAGGLPSGPAVPVLPQAGRAPDGLDCPSRLGAANVVVERTSIAPQPDPQCTVVDAVRLTALRLGDGAVVTFPDRPTIACTTASTFSAFVRDLLSPLAKGTYGSVVDTVWTGPGLDCRTRDRIPGAKLSAHGQGLAVDIAQLRLQDGRKIEVGRPKSEVDRAFETAALAGGCGYFHTALGPGADAFHETHWHLDLIPRGAKSDSKFCEWTVD